MPTVQIDAGALVRDSVFGETRAREKSRRQIHEVALARDVFPASIYPFYEARGKGLNGGFTVPAINIRGITYEVARAVLRAAMKNHVGAFIFEISRGEMVYTGQTPGEYAACVLAAAIREGFSGPIFLQGDHYQVNPDSYNSDANREMESIRKLILKSIRAGFFNIDIDASTLVDMDKSNLDAQQEKNCLVTAGLTGFIRKGEPEQTTISIGGEIGEVGGRNSTVADLGAFMTGYRRALEPGVGGLSKISAQTGTTHGGVVLPDGSVASVDIDFKTLKELSRAAQREYGMAGAVQHGASTLPDEAFDLFPQADTLEVHLATGFQNIIFDSQHFPDDLRKRIYKHLQATYAGEMKPGETREQFLYKTRKKAFGDFKKELWNMPPRNQMEIAAALEERFSILFHRLKVTGTDTVVRRFVGS